jgi:CheY-like chemotaxis protein
MDCGLVLIVDDDVIIRQALESMLEGAGYVCVSVGNGNDALNYLSTGRPPCLIVLDLTLPDIAGVDLHATIRADSTLAKVPVVVVTGDAEPPRLPGVFATVIKGGALDLLLGTVDAACGRSARSN